MPFHPDLATGRWQTFSLAEQLGNIGSEVSRAINWREKGDVEKSANALARGLELFDLTLADSRWHGRRRELARSREVVCDYLVGENAYASTSDELQSYFDAFALVARRER